MYFINSFFKKIFPSCVLFFLIINCEYYKAYKYNEEGIKELNETKLEDSKTSFYKSISYSYKSYIPTYNIGYTLLQQDDLPAAHEKFQQAIEANPEFKEALYNDGQTLYLWGKKEVNPDSCNTERAKLLWEQAMLRFNETAELTNAGDYKKPSLANIKFIQNEISKLDNLKENNCKNQSEEQNDPNSESDQGEQEQKNQSEDNQANNEDNSQDKKDSEQDGKDSKDNKDSGKDGKDSKDKKDSGKDGKDSKDSKDSGKDGKDSKDSKDSGKDGKDSKDKKDSGKDGKDSKDKKDSGKDGKDSKDSKDSGKDGKDSKDKKDSGKDGKDSKDKKDSGKDGKDSKDKKDSGTGGEQTEGQENANENQAGDNGYIPDDEGGNPKSVLTPEEQMRLKKEMDRVQKRSTESKTHKRSRHQQDKIKKDQDELEKGLREALW